LTDREKYGETGPSKTEGITFDKEFGRALGDAGGVRGSAREDPRVFNENLSYGEYELLAFTQHLQYIITTSL